jgi:hypothetical protein
MTIETKGTTINNTGNKYLEDALRGSFTAMLGKMQPGTANGRLGVLCIKNKPAAGEEATLFSLDIATDGYAGDWESVPETLKYLSETGCAVFGNGFSVVYEDAAEERDEKWCFAFADDGNMGFDGLFTVNAFQSVVTAMRMRERDAHLKEDAKAMAKSVGGLIEAVMTGDEEAFEKFECPLREIENNRKDPVYYFGINQAKADGTLYFCINLMLPEILED